jgi:hypothetical protein
MEHVDVKLAKNAAEPIVVYTGTQVHPYVDETDTLTLRVANTFQANAQIVIDVFYALGA